MPRLLDAYTRSPVDLGERSPEVLVAMGEHLVPAVAGELASGSPARARRGAELLGATQHPRGVTFLTEQLRHADPGVRREVARALARIGTRRAVHALIDALRAEADVAEFAALGLGESASRQAQAALADVAADEQVAHALRGHAIRALGRLGDPASIPLLESVLGTRRLLRAWRQRPLRLLAAEALARVGGERARVALEAFADDGDRAVRTACREGLRSLRS
jgi:HEAT repeat protein